MTNACPIPTSAERQYGEIQTRIQLALTGTIYAALQEATEQAKREMAAAGLDMPPPSKGYFAAGIHQKLYCTLCDADPETFRGGKPAAAIAILRNYQQIARHQWGADVEVYPRI